MTSKRDFRIHVESEQRGSSSHPTIREFQSANNIACGAFNRVLRNSERQPDRSPMTKIASAIEEWNKPKITKYLEAPASFWPEDIHWVQDRNPGDPFVPGTIAPRELRLTDEKRESDGHISVISEYIFPSYKDPKPVKPDPSMECTAIDCPLVRVLKIPHKQGHYFHRGYPMTERSMFGTSDPPPAVWSAYGRLTDSDDKDDKDMVIPFAYCHFGYPDDHFDVGIEVRGWTRFTRNFQRECRRVFKEDSRSTKSAGRFGLRTFLLSK